MAFCPNCGSAYEEGTKFCGSCGSALPVPQPVQQPVSQPIQPVYQKPVQPEVQQQVQPVYQQPPVMPPVQNVQSTNAVRKNGFCTAGFVLSLLGFVTAGVTGLFGLIFSIAGIISAKKKQQSGKGKAIAGIIMALVQFLVYGALFAVLGMRYTEIASEVRNTEMPEQETVDYGEMIAGRGWVLAEDGSYIKFNGKDNSVIKCMSYLDTTGNYSSGHYEIYCGRKAVRYLTKKAGDSSLSADELEDIIDSGKDYGEDNLIAITCDYEEGFYDDGVLSGWKPETVHMYGFYVSLEKDDESYDAIEITELESGDTYTLIREDQYYDYKGNEPVPSSETTEQSETDITNETIETHETVETHETIDRSLYDEDLIVGDDMTGTIVLTQGSWGIWTEADSGDMDNFIWSRHQRINLETGTIINLTTFSIVTDSDNVALFAEAAKQSMENDGSIVKDYSETVLGGYKAYTVTSQYQDGMFLTVWYFIDENNYLHYVSVEYFQSDYVSYEMVRDTFSFG